MLPFCGYNMGDYFGYWLSFAKENRNALPKIFFVNWFRKTADGRWLWPGYGENSRVLKWICERVEGTGKAQETPIGYLPTPDAIDLSDCKVSDEDMAELLKVDKEGWIKEIESIGQNYARYGAHLPAALTAQLDELKARLNK
jgi:phosphoenolpyruvate carboxykinase (GTP)